MMGNKNKSTEFDTGETGMTESQLDIEIIASEGFVTPDDTMTVVDHNRSDHNDDVVYGYQIVLPREDMDAEQYLYNYNNELGDEDVTLLDSGQDGRIGWFVLSGNPNKIGLLHLKYNEENVGENNGAVISLSKTADDGEGVIPLDHDIVEWEVIDAPEANLELDTDTVEPGDTITADASGSDTGSQDVDYEWDITNGEVAYGDSGETVDVIVDDAGDIDNDNYKLEVKVKLVEEGGGREYDDAYVEADIRVAPTFDLDVTPSDPVGGEEITVEPTNVDLRGGELDRFTVESSGPQEEFDFDPDTGTFVFVPSQAAEWEITITAEDTRGGVGEETVILNVDGDPDLSYSGSIESAFGYRPRAEWTVTNDGTDVGTAEVLIKGLEAPLGNTTVLHQETIDVGIDETETGQRNVYAEPGLNKIVLEIDGEMVDDLLLDDGGGIISPTDGESID